MIEKSPLTLIDDLVLDIQQDNIRAFVISDFHHLSAIFGSHSGSGATQPPVAPVTHPKLGEAVNYLYSRLSVVDNKSMALLQISALIIAIAALGLEPMKITDGSLAHWIYKILAWISVAASCLGSLIALRGARIKYEQVGLEPKGAAINNFLASLDAEPKFVSESSKFGCSEEITRYLCVVSTVTSIRVINVRIVRGLTIASILALIVAFTLGTFAPQESESPSISPTNIACPIILKPPPVAVSGAYPFSIGIEVPLKENNLTHCHLK